MLPRPIGGSPFVIAELHAASADDLQTTFDITLKQAHLQIVPAIEVLPGSIEHRLAIGGGRQFARQIQQLVGLFLGFPQRLQLAALACGQVAGKRRHQQKEQRSQYIFFSLDAEGEVWRDKQKIIRQEGH
ncbi:hypothetical protein D3C78_1025580 [compost metagenome]